MILRDGRVRAANLMIISRLIAIGGIVSVSCFGATAADNCKIDKVATIPLVYSNGQAAVTVKIDGAEVPNGRRYRRANAGYATDRRSFPFEPGHRAQDAGHRDHSDYHR